jgi:spore germination protein GerM
MTRAEPLLRRRGGRWVLVAAAVVAAGSLTGCGLSAEENPEPVEVAELPTSVAATEDDTMSVLTDKDTRAVWLLDNGRLVREVRQVDPPADVAATVNALLLGPTEEENLLGLRSAIPPGTRLIDAAVDGNVVTLNLSDEFAGVGGDAQRSALGQLVWTATAVPGIDGVLIAVGNEPVSVPDAGGELIDRPLVRADFARVPVSTAPAAAPVRGPRG